MVCSIDIDSRLAKMEQELDASLYNCIVYGDLFWPNLLGMRETNLRGLSTRKDRNIRKSKSTFASAKMVMDLHKVR